MSQLMYCSTHACGYHVNYIWLKNDTYLKEVAQHSMFLLVHEIKACITCGLTCEYYMICQLKDCYFFDQCIKCRHCWHTILTALCCAIPVEYHTYF